MLYQLSYNGKGRDSNGLPPFDQSFIDEFMRHAPENTPTSPVHATMRSGLTAEITMPPFEIHYASLDDLEALVPLFDAYRVFYQQPSDPVLARNFLGERLSRHESVIVLARAHGTHQPLGFIQLYPAFSSVVAGRIWILNDLFVAPQARHQGVARALLQRARKHAAATGSIRLVLETGEDNHIAQRLYESTGWQREAGFHYQLAVP
ncbi:MAG TPA: GNAT family N-acetyltransferase [Rhodanobacteraceae bacterium]